MKTPEDEAFEDIERRQGGGFPAKRAMAADKQEPWDWAAHEYDGVHRKAQPAQEPVAFVHIKDECLVGSHRDQSKPFPDGQYGLWPIAAPPLPVQPAQEPDYWLGYGLQAHTEKPFEGATPLYTTPPKREWVGLTDEDRKAALLTAYKEWECEEFLLCAREDYLLIEQALKEKNT